MLSTNTQSNENAALVTVELAPFVLVTARPSMMMLGIIKKNIENHGPTMDSMCSRASLVVVVHHN